MKLKARLIPASLGFLLAIHYSFVWILNCYSGVELLGTASVDGKRKLQTGRKHDGVTAERRLQQYKQREKLSGSNSSDIQPIPVDPSSTLAKDILSIHHDVTEPQTPRVVVTIRPGARCPRPYLVGRLSGSYLAKLNWTWNATDRSNLVGSGLGLSHIKKKGTTTTPAITTTTTMEGSYKVPEGGAYFLEIIAVFCEDFFAKKDEATNSESLSNSKQGLAFNFTDTCLEDLLHHRITTKGASIIVPDVKDRTVLNALDQSRGFWRRQSQQQSMVAANSSQFWAYNSMLYMSPEGSTSIVATAASESTHAPKPLYTRIQPYQRCYQSQKDKVALPQECITDTFLDRFQSYRFEWNNPSFWASWMTSPQTIRDEIMNAPSTTKSIEGNNDKIEAKKSPPALEAALLLDNVEDVNICFLGFSHSRKLVEAGRRIGLYHRLIPIMPQNPSTPSRLQNVTVHWIPAHYPGELTSTRISSVWKGRDCHKFVVAAGQWSASFQGGSPTLVDDYYREMRTVWQNFNIAAADRLSSSQNVPVPHDSQHIAKPTVYARNIHYNSLSYSIGGSCPPEDWRSPLVIDTYNHVIERTCKEFQQGHDANGTAPNSINVRYLDTTFLTDAVWDSNPDWAHHASGISELEVQYIVANVLGMVGDDGRGSAVREEMQTTMGR